MSSDRPKSDAVIWQGYHHTWGYNHRVNRMGSYVRYQPGPEGRLEPVAGHSAASGTGADVARFSEFVTGVQAKGVGFQAGYGETLVECMRAETTLFRIKVDELELGPELAGKTDYTVIINGFDLIAEADAGKILSFDLEVTDPTVSAGGRQIRFNILGSLCFDCRSPECELMPFRFVIEDVESEEGAAVPDESARPPSPEQISSRQRGIPRDRLERAVNWLKRQLVAITNMDEVKRTVIGSDETALKRRLFRIFHKRVFLKLTKWRLPTPYTLRVHYLIIGGDGDSLHVTESDFFESSYAWDLDKEIHRAELGTQRIEVEGRPLGDYGVNTLAFKHISLEVVLDEDAGASNPVQWGKGMHFLEWSLAVRDIQASNGVVGASLDLFYKCWSEAMNEYITIFTWGSFRDAGSARLGARMTLLQFKDAATTSQLEMPGRIRWPGLGLSSKGHPWARFERRIVFERGKGDGNQNSH
jgi:hypothetical protein